MIVWVLALYAAGIALLLIEFLLPGMVLGVIGAAMIIASGVIGVMNYPDQAILVVLGELVGVVAAIVLGFWLLTRSKIVRGRLTLETSQKAEDGYVSAVSDTSLIGQCGEVITALRPAGTIRIANRRIDAVSDGVFVEERKVVRVREVRGSRVVVDPCEENQ